MGARLSKILKAGKMSSAVTSQSSRPPTHDEVARFLASFLPPLPRPRDVEYHYHVPRQYIQPKPVATAPDMSSRTFDDRLDAMVAPLLAAPTTMNVLPVVTDGATTLPAAPQALPPLPNNTPVSHLTISIKPTPGFYESVTKAKSGTSRHTSPLAFVHRPWGLEWRALPRGTTVLASHTGFDECLTVGWNVQLARQLGVDIGAEGAESEKCVCLKGYKGDEERRIGLVGGFGSDRERVKGIRMRAQVEDDDGGVRLDATAPNAADLENDGAVPVPQVASSTLAEMLSRIETQFQGVGEVFDFTSPLYAGTEFAANVADHKVPLSTGISTEESSVPIETNITTPSISAQVLEPAQPQRKRQKKAKKPKAPPPPPVPPSIPLASCSSSPLMCNKDAPVTAIAIMNAFHAEEVERAIDAARSRGWIKWTSRIDRADTADPIVTESILVGHDASNSTLKESEVQAVSSSIQDMNGMPSCHSVSPPQYPSQANTRVRTGRLLVLTGAPRAPGLAHVAKHYASLITVVCVGHAACEEWGIRFLAGQCRRQWRGLDVEEVYEHEGEGAREEADNKR
jgi:putative NIF3 family GTP cyclohydrolase 1 type 2